MKVIDKIALVLIIIGAINWGLIGLFKFNLVELIFGDMTVLARIIYTLVGISGLWGIKREKMLKISKKWLNHFFCLKIKEI